MATLVSAFVTVANMSITAGWIVLAVLLLRPVLLRLPRIFAYLLWLPVFVRLLCPVSFTSIFSLFVLTDSGVRASEPVAALAVQDTAPLASSMEWASPPQGGVPQLLPMLAVVWLVVAALLFGCLLVSWVRLHLRLRTAVRLAQGVYSSERVSAPFVFGLLCPVIYLLADTAAADRDCLLRHERVHLRRRDYLTKPLCCLALCLHWFNPLVWVAVRLAGRDMEISCDELVLSQLGESARQQYSLLLLRMAADRHSGSVGLASFGEPDVKRRIKNVLNYKHPAIKKVAVGVALVAALSLVLLANPATAPQQALAAPASQTASHPMPKPVSEPTPDPLPEPPSESRSLQPPEQSVIAAEPVTTPVTPPEQLQPASSTLQAQPADTSADPADEPTEPKYLGKEDLPDIDANLIWPMDGGYISAGVYAYPGHTGADISAPYGTEIYAAAAGTVTYAVNSSVGAYGKRLDIDHGNGLITRYGHCSEVLVATGDTVEQGQLIAKVGRTGNAYGNHCHFELRYGPDGQIVNVTDYIGKTAPQK